MFISYVREDKARVDRLQQILERAGVPVWRDTQDLWPGEDWKQRIREAITSGAFVFLACFSAESSRRAKSYQNAELALATEELRLRPPGTPWLIPVLFDEVPMPTYELGGGRSLDNIQRADLSGMDWTEGSTRLVASILRILDNTSEASKALAKPPADIADRLTTALRDPAADIALEEELVMPVANEVHLALADSSRFPFQAAEIGQGHPTAARYVANRVEDYWAAVEPLLTVLIRGCAWSLPQHEGVWTRAISRAANVPRDATGNAVLVELRRFPAIPLLYGAGLAALSRDNLGALRAVAVDAEVRTERGKVPLVGTAHLGMPFSNYELPAQLLALTTDSVDVTDDDIEALAAGRKGRRYTPISDYLHRRLRPAFRVLVPDDEDYTEMFDGLEVFLGLLATDAKLQRTEGGPFLPVWFGAFTWRNRHVEDDQFIERRVEKQFNADPSGWPPIRAGFFGRDADRAAAAFENFIQAAGRARRERW